MPLNMKNINMRPSLGTDEALVCANVALPGPAHSPEKPGKGHVEFLNHRTQVDQTSKTVMGGQQQLFFRAGVVIITASKMKRELFLRLPCSSASMKFLIHHILHCLLCKLLCLKTFLSSTSQLLLAFQVSNSTSSIKYSLKLPTLFRLCYAVLFFIPKELVLTTM